MLDLRPGSRVRHRETQRTGKIVSVAQCAQALSEDTTDLNSLGLDVWWDHGELEYCLPAALLEPLLETV